MNKTETANQLRLAAGIIETEHPWEYSPDGFSWRLSEGKCPMYAVSQGWQIRLATWSPPPFKLPPPPPGMEWHCEDGWTEEMLPEGYRPLVDGEFIQDGDEVRNKNLDNFQFVKASCSVGHKAGESFPAQIGRTTRPLTFTHEGRQWTYHLPGDPMPCDGEALIEAVYGEHKDSRKAADYNWDSRTSVFGWRYADEKPDPYAELKKAHATGKVIQAMSAGGWLEPTIPLWTSSPENYRIKPDEIPWIEWHGGECPLKDEVEEWEIMFRDSSKVINSKGCPAQMRWTHEAEKSDGDIVRYRVLKARETTLGPEDVPPFSLLRVKGMSDPWNWTPVEAVDPYFGIRVISKEVDTPHEWIGWGCLDDREINRPRYRDADGNPTFWEPCHKPKPLANG